MDKKKEPWEERDSDPHLIPCIGVDNLKHVCYPWETKCYCGVEVLRKKYLREDWKLFGCYECTY